MHHRITLASNPRLAILFFLVIALPVAGVLLLILAGVLAGILALAGAAYVDFMMLRFLRNHVKSWVETTEAKLACRLPDGQLLEFPWAKVSAAGYCTQERNRPFLFLYREDGDTLLTIPKEYSNFDALYSELESRTPFQKLSLGRAETIQERLKEMLQIAAAGDAEKGAEERKNSG
jgi:hypothetical protein